VPREAPRSRRRCDRADRRRPSLVRRPRINRIKRIVTDNGACYRAEPFARALLGSRHQRIKPYTPRHNGKAKRYNRIISEQFFYARTWTSEDQRRVALGVWNIHYNYHRPNSAADGNSPRRHCCRPA
jgi:transposase InsO family protein